MKKITKDDYVHSVYKVIFYIEQHYDRELTLEELAKVAGFSKYHFHRIFKSIVDERLGDYIRRVRLQDSTIKLINNQKITDIALSSGYETNASFSKAFKKHFGMTPKAFAQSVKKREGVKMLEPALVTLEPLEVLYVRREGDYHTSAPLAWEAVCGFAYGQKYKNHKSLMGDEAVMIGISHDDPHTTPIEKLRYDACVSWDDKSVDPEGEVFGKTIEGGKYAMFLHKGAYEGLQNTYDLIWNWVTESGVELKDLPVFEKYLNKDPRKTKPQNLRTEIYLPIK
ncbi:MAG: AraC family transcriptional regulator [Epsilonproteobacteria bacterium]|nr:AraC family transcriptional regulator [Campylobacterota bacterium]